MKRDNTIFELIKKEYDRQLNGIELIASENFVSNQVLEAMGSCLTNKYAEGLPGKRYYGGCQVVDEVEQLAIDRVKELFNAGWNPEKQSESGVAILALFLMVADTIISDP